ncbi:MAG: MoxR family ATPase [Kiritimatiellia bacterium]|jgi:MoxR-like ATPase|nr:MoxR family ATPase [Kiritimatiellia bacterium]MDD4441456.1 MoxR family ATPase [Kiritimatiellia bacterium]
MTTCAGEKWEHVRSQMEALRKSIGTVIVGQDAVVELLLTSLLCKGHCLIVGVPGLAKTLLVTTLGKALGLVSRRIQFTPDLMPMDITGGEILQEESGGRRRFEFAPGPIFANLILADEINRTPPKTQAALLEAMQEKQVTVSGKSMRLTEPFIVFATQNPIEHEGTYPLPEAQLDRFFFSLTMDYPPMEQERDIVLRTTGRGVAEPQKALEAEEVLALQDMILDVPVPEHVLNAILRTVNATRPNSPLAGEHVKRYVAWGAGPRASQTMTSAVKALALLRGQSAASLEEVRAVMKPVLRHRVIPNYNATGEGVTVDQIIEKLEASL